VLSFQSETADKRYKNLITKKEYMQETPLKHVASFIGVTDSSLSRIRRKNIR
jgi:hypothetical protein